MPSISGPSITWIGRGYFKRASPVSAMMCVDTPLLRADPAHRFEVFNAVARMLVQPRRNGEDVRIEDDVLGRVAHAGEQPVGALGNGDAPLERVGLALLVERHDDHRRAVAAAEPRL